MVKKKDLKYLNKTYQELFKMKRVLDSCITQEQFNNCASWCNQIMEKWNFQEQYLSNKAQKIIFNIVINDLDKSYKENLERIKNNIAIETKNSKFKSIFLRCFFSFFYTHHN